MSISIFFNLFGSQSRVSNSNAEEMVDVSSSIEPRYPKRKRAQVKYNEIDGQEFLLDGEIEEEYEPKTKKPKTSKPSKPLPKHKIFPFMRLPAELRNRIYGFSLSNDGDVYITSTTKGYRRIAKRCTQSDCVPQFLRHHHRSYSRFNGNSYEDEEELPRRTPNSVSPNLLAVSKTIYAEAASFLYGQRISVADNYTLLSFLNQIGRQHTSMLREVSIKKWCSGRAHRSINFPAMTLLASATNLELLDIDCAFGYFSSYYGRKKQSIPNRVARKAFRDCYPWFEAIGKEKGKADAAVEMIQIHESNFGRNYSRGNDVEEPEMDENLEGFRQELRRLLKA